MCFWDNEASISGNEIYNSTQSSPTVTYSDVEGGYSGTGNINSEPVFVDDTDPDGNDDEWMTSDDGLALDSGSPCIDEGNNIAISESYDIAGNTRKIDGDENSSVIVDMGAYEYDPS